MIVSICNFKGGVAKTSSTLNIGAGLARKGQRVLLIDMDPQYNLTTSLGIPEVERSVYESLMKKETLPIHPITDNLDLVPSSIELNKAQIELASEFKREGRLMDLLSPIQDQYDYILIDCPPSLGLLTINALVASDLIFVPIEAEYLALKGYSVLKDSLDRIGMELDRLFITKFDGRTILHRDIAASIRAHAGDKVFNTQIRKNVSVAEATTQGLDIFRYDADSNGAVDYAALVEEIMKI
ncbi:UNVERIFIED_CONTAM: hypothetical protein GTU68_019750 [Idotea baltica]|nr:hypothetical protein [Idotea baltica]